MIHGIVFLVVAAVAGFGTGRIKNASKLAAINSELEKVKAGASAEVDKVVAAVKSHL